jgi:hypothetical protein
MLRQTTSTIESVFPESIETSSIISVFDFFTFLIILFLAEIEARSLGERLFFMHIPLHEWTVIPPICVAAIPVEAVTAGSIPRPRKYSAYSFTA